MAYSAILGDSQQLAIANLGTQTQISLTTATPGQQQSQSSSFSTGTWTSEPKLFQAGVGFVLQIDGEQNSYHILIQQNSISTIQPPANLSNCPRVELKAVPAGNNNAVSKVEPMQPMQPMKPLKMGNMSMDINSMSMQMGNMSLGFDNQSKSSVTKQFCSQCGTEAKTGDRFCRNCGHELAK